MLSPVSHPAITNRPLARETPVHTDASVPSSKERATAQLKQLTESYELQGFELAERREIINTWQSWWASQSSQCCQELAWLLEHALITTVYGESQGRRSIASTEAEQFRDVIFVTCRIAELQHPEIVSTQLLSKHRVLLDAWYAQWTVVMQAYHAKHVLWIQTFEERKQFSLRWRMVHQIALCSLHCRRDRTRMSARQQQHENSSNANNGDCTAIVQGAIRHLQSAIHDDEQLLFQSVPESYVASQIALRLTQRSGMLSYVERRLVPLALREDITIRHVVRWYGKKWRELVEHEQWTRCRLEWEEAQDAERLDVFARLLR